MKKELSSILEDKEFSLGHTASITKQSLKYPIVGQLVADTFKRGLSESPKIDLKSLADNNITGDLQLSQSMKQKAAQTLN